MRLGLKRARGGTLPYWAVLPSSLARVYGGDAGLKEHRAFLEDAVWAQYCLFRCIRLQDDIFDRQEDDLSQLFASNGFLIEAERTFAKHFPRSGAFWQALYHALERTTEGIIAADNLQRRPGGDPRALLAVYTRVDSIFTVGAGAVCTLFGRGADLASLGELACEVAMASQILDDLKDLAEDLRRERFNYVAKRLLSGEAPITIDRATRLIGREIALGDGTARVLDEARRHFRRARAISDQLGCVEMRDYLAAGEKAMELAKAGFHRAQVRNTFASLAKTGHAG